VPTTTVKYQPAVKYQLNNQALSSGKGAEWAGRFSGQTKYCLVIKCLVIQGKGNEKHSKYY
jgi:hypothetical protein